MDRGPQLAKEDTSLVTGILELGVAASGTSPLPLKRCEVPGEGTVSFQGHRKALPFQTQSRLHRHGLPAVPAGPAPCLTTTPPATAPMSPWRPHLPPPQSSSRGSTLCLSQPSPAPAHAHLDLRSIEFDLLGALRLRRRCRCGSGGGGRGHFGLGIFLLGIRLFGGHGGCELSEGGGGGCRQQGSPAPGLYPPGHL